MTIPWDRVPAVGLSETVALAAVALIGYLFGQRTRKQKLAALDAQRYRALERASGIARQLELIAGALRLDLASHHGQLTRFRRRLNEARESGDDQSWQLLCTEAEMILAPTMQLAQQLSLAYDAIRQQSDALETFTQARTDPVTGVGNSRALEEKLDVLLTSVARNDTDFAIALVSLDRNTTPGEPTNANKKSRLPELARLIQSCMRESDFVARYGDDEFVVLMPQTKLSGASVFAERLLKIVVERMSATVSCGMAEYQPHDSEKSLLGRADSAVYSAKAAGGNRLFVHAGSQIREHRPSGAPRTSDGGSGRATPPATPSIAPLDLAADPSPAAAQPAGM